MKSNFLSKSIAMVLTIALMGALIVPAASAASAVTISGIDPAEFADPGFECRPGVRWWWPGNAAKTEDLVAQVDYLADNGFGMVEIAGFTNGFLPATGPETTATNSNISHAMAGYDVAAINSYGTLAYYQKLEAVVKRCNERGIIVDLNMGSGYLANDFSLALEDSQAHMALGRKTITAADTNPITGIEVPEVEASIFYGAKIQGSLAGDWDASTAHLCAVIVAQITNANAASLSSPRNRTLDFTNPLAPVFLKTYEQRLNLDFENATVYEAFELVDGKIPSFTPSAAASYEVIALYSIPTGSVALNAIRQNAEGKRAYVVDHMNAEAVKNYIHGWLGNPGMDKVVENYNIRGAFNDSYEFWMDRYFNEKVYELAKEEAGPNGLLGYDLTKYIPSFYGVLTNSFTMSGNGGLGFYYDSLTGWGTGAVQFFNTVDSRILYDYNQLINKTFMEGMKAFSDTLGEYNADGSGILYRQQAYNPPIDTLKAAKYVDIPEGEQENETGLRRVSSGAHLYGKNLVTAEEFTLGNVPFNVTPQKMKLSYDLFAVSGVNNIFYHGLNAPYYGSGSEMENGLFPEEGWRGWSTIGVEMADTEAISPYYKTMNMYYARANYAMQAGKPSSDVALYMPLFGSVSANAPVVTMNRNGLTWDVINDDTITDDLIWQGGKLTNGIMDYSALIVNNTTVPVKTMQALKALAAAGAPIIFTAMPNAQPSYCGGDYATQDALVVTLASEALAAGATQITVSGSTYSAALADKLLSVCKPGINYDQQDNDDVRLNRRTLTSGGELAYIRNASTSADRSITLKVDPSLPNAYWLDQSNGKIYKAALTNGSVTITLKAVGAIILLCEPAGVTLDDEVVYGLPFAIEQYHVIDSANLTDADFALTVTADNFNVSGGTTAGVLPGADETRVLTGAVLGSWVASGFQDNLLRYVSSPGVYATKIQVDDLDSYASNRMVLDLGTVNNAATVIVNDVVVGQLFAAPYQIDITDALLLGENEIKIEVQPLKHNRRIGLYQLYNSDKALYKQYMYYAGNVSGTTPVAAGLVGPVNLLTVEGRGASTVEASIRTTPTVAIGGPASYTVSLMNATNSGIVTLSFTFDSRYLDLTTATPLNGFTFAPGGALAWEYVGGQMWKGTVKLYCPGFAKTNNPLDVLEISGVAGNLLGDTTVTLTDFTVTGDVYGFSGVMPSLIKTAEAATSIVTKTVFSKYDLNHDGRIDELDLAIVVYYYLANDLEADWDVVKFDIASAKDCDVALNGRVDLADMIEVIANYCDSY
ncbi:MAG: hypothetical protein FWH55_09655 [Oscillospiraceae bacterium]|nr:hypothetical protein [Oscillospiraceae bacterium]